jgi:hypothetical protein
MEFDRLGIVQLKSSVRPRATTARIDATPIFLTAISSRLPGNSVFGSSPPPQSELS